jgi:hypothetical protein
MPPLTIRAARPLLFGFLLFWATGLSAQEKPKKWKLADLSIWAGTSFGEAPTKLGDYYDFLRDTSLLVAPALNDFRAGCSPYCYLFDAPAIYVGFGVGRHPLLPDGKGYSDRSEWRIGGGVQFRSQVLGFQHETPGTGDTLAFASVSYRLVQFEPSFEMIWLFLTDPRRKIVAYGGGGFRLGVPVVTRVDEVIQNGTALVTERQPYRYIYAVDETYQGIRTAQPVYLRLYLPAGVRFRLGKNLQLCLEVNAGFSYRHLFPGGGRPSYFLAGMLGIRSRFGR